VWVIHRSFHELPPQFPIAPSFFNRKERKESKLFRRSRNMGSRQYGLGTGALIIIIQSCYFNGDEDFFDGTGTNDASYKYLSDCIIGGMNVALSGRFGV